MAISSARLRSPASIRSRARSTTASARNRVEPVPSVSASARSAWRAAAVGSPLTQHARAGRAPPPPLHFVARGLEERDCPFRVRERPAADVQCGLRPLEREPGALDVVLGLEPERRGVEAVAEASCRAPRRGRPPRRTRSARARAGRTRCPPRVRARCGSVVVREHLGPVAARSGGSSIHSAARRCLSAARPAGSASRRRRGRAHARTVFLLACDRAVQLAADELLAHEGVESARRSADAIPRAAPPARSPADHGGVLEQRLLVGREQVEPRRDDPLHRLRQAR